MGQKSSRLNIISSDEIASSSDDCFASSGISNSNSNNNNCKNIKNNIHESDIMSTYYDSGSIAYKVFNPTSVNNSNNNNTSESIAAADLISNKNIITPTTINENSENILNLNNKSELINLRSSIKSNNSKKITNDRLVVFSNRSNTYLIDEQQQNNLNELNTQIDNAIKSNNSLCLTTSTNKNRDSLNKSNENINKLNQNQNNTFNLFSYGKQESLKLFKDLRFYKFEQKKTTQKEQKENNNNNNNNNQLIIENHLNNHKQQQHHHHHNLSLPTTDLKFFTTNTSDNKSTSLEISSMSASSGKSFEKLNFFYNESLDLHENNNIENAYSNQMSANYSSGNLINGNEDDNINNDNKRLLDYSYKLIKNDLNQLGVIAFMKSFETLPDMKDKFESFRHLQIDELSTSHALRTHSRKVMNIIDQLLLAIEKNQLKEFRKKLFELGERHHIYRAKKNYFLIIEHQFINAIKPIIMKNLALMTKSSLSEISEVFNKILDVEDIEISNSEIDLEVNLSVKEIEESYKLFENAWHKLFAIIILEMSNGIDKIETNKKKALELKKKTKKTLTLIFKKIYVTTTY